MEHELEQLTIQEVAELSGLSAHTLRYYERIGLLRPIGRAANGHRRYSQVDVSLVIFLTYLRATGMPLRQMRAYVQYLEDGPESIQQRLSMLEEHRRTVQAHMAELQRNMAAIEKKIALYQELLESTPTT